MSEFKKKKNIRDVVIGDFVRQIKSTSGKKKCGEVLAILEDNVGDPTIECVEVHPDELTPLEKGSDGIRTFKSKRSKLKMYTPRKTLFAKKTFEKGDVIQHKRGGSFRYGRIVCFVHPDGLYSTSHEEGYNGKDLLECVEIEKKPGLMQFQDWLGAGIASSLVAVPSPENMKARAVSILAGRGLIV